MRDDEQGLAGLFDFGEKVRQECPGCLMVKAAGRLIEQDDGLFARDGDGCQQAIALAAGEAAGIFAERRIDALRQLLYEVRELCRVKCRTYVAFVARGAVPLEILAYGPGEQDAALGQCGDGRMKNVMGNMLAGCSMQQQRSRVGRPDAEQEIGERGLAGAAGPDDGGVLAGADGKGKIVQEVLTPTVGKGESLRGKEGPVC